MDKEGESVLQVKKTTCYNEDHQTPSCSKYCQFDTIEEKLKKLEKISADVSRHQDMLTEVKERVNEQKKKSKDKADQIPFENLGKLIQATVNASKKFNSSCEVDIARGVLDIISSLAVLQNHPEGPAIKALCSVISTILTHQKPKQPSVVEQLAKIVHGELVNFNKKLQDQKYDGLRRRVTDQVDQLRTMKPGEQLDDPSLWNDYVQFMGELSNRFESPVPFKYDKASLSKDPDVADFVTAVMTYCQAYSCFMALLIAVKGKFSEMGGKYKKDEEVVDRKIRCQKEDAVQKLAFLSDEKNLTFLGRLPYEGGKLTKILVLSRKLQHKMLIEVVRSSLNMPRMPELAKVESTAEKVSRQSVKLKLDERHQVPPGNLFSWMVSLMFGPKFWVQFINETDFPMKLVLATVGSSDNSLMFHDKDVDLLPRSSHSQGLNTQDLSEFSSGGYLIINLNGTLSSKSESPAGNTRVIEFALSRNMMPWVVFGENQINVLDKTGDEFTRGQDAYEAMKSGDVKTLYWFENGVHYIVRAEIINGFFKGIWRFIVQDFDPVEVQD